MVLSVLNSDPSLRKAHSGLSPEKIPASPPKNNRRSRAHNIPGGIKHLLSDPKRRRHARSTSLPSSHRSHPRRLARRKPTAKQILLASAALASEAQPSPSPQSRSRSQSHASVPISVSFPRRLPVLPRKQMSSEVLASLGFTSEVPSQYIRDQMERLGPIMYRALRSTKATASGSTLPKALVINVNDQTSVMLPTHMVAVYSSASSASEPRRVTMYPIHQSILSLYCSNLPVLPASTALPTAPGTSFEVPVVPLAVPNPESFPILIQFLYLKDVHALLNAFLCLTPSEGIPDDLKEPAQYDSFVAEYSTILAQNYTAHRLAGQAARIHGLWRNASALGISDIDLQAFLDLAWEVLMQALTLSSNNSAPVVVFT